MRTTRWRRGRTEGRFVRTGRRWLVVVLMILMVSAMAGCPRQREGSQPVTALPIPADDAVTRADAPEETDAVGRWVSWREQVPDPTIPSHLPSGARLQIAPGGQWVAGLGSNYRLRVWAVGEQGTLESLIWDSASVGRFVTDFVWAGERIVFSELTALQNPEELKEHESFYSGPAYNSHEYQAEHTQTSVYDPQTGEVALLLEEGGGTLFADAEGETLVICCATFDYNYTQSSMRGRPPVADVHVYSLAEHKWLRDFVVCIGNRVGTWQAMRLRRLVSDGERLYLVTKGKVESQTPPGETPAERPEAVAVIDLSSSSQFLTDGGSNQCYERAHKFPALVTTADGRSAVVCVLQDQDENPERLMVYALDGSVLHEYEFGPAWRRLREATGRPTQEWHPITVTPDGRQLIVKEAGVRRSEVHREAAWVWLYDLESGDAQPLVLCEGMGFIYGWLGGEYLVTSLHSGPYGRISDPGALYVPWRGD